MKITKEYIDIVSLNDEYKTPPIAKSRIPELRFYPNLIKVFALANRKTKKNIW